MRRRLLDHGAAGVTIASVHLPDWLAMGLVGMGPVTLRAARAVREARRRAARPVLVVGHSAGGIIARLAMSPVGVDGRRPAVAEDVGCLVTLGTPHRLDPVLGWRHAGMRATELLDRAVPGAWHAPTTGYLTVGSTLCGWADPVPTNPLKRGIGGLMRLFVGETPGGRSDGIVEDARSRLEGVQHLSLPDVLHGTFGGPWYGDSAVIDRWWPAALEAWLDALAARRGGAGAAS
jgi:hypothetical protein